MNRFLFRVALIAALGGFLFGYDSSVVADVEDQVIQQLSLDSWHWSLVVSISLLGSMLGIPLSGLMADRLSRRFLLQITAAGFVAGTAACALAESFFLLLAGRFLIGLCIGIASYLVPLFIAEIAAPSERGALVILNGIAITLGQSLAFLLGYFLHDLAASSWRWLFFMGCIPALIMCIGLMRIPHPPRWQLQKKGWDAALDVLQKIRPTGYDSQQELQEMQSNLQRPRASYRRLFQKPLLSVLLLGCLLGIFQQLSGISALMYYGPLLFQSIGFFPVKKAILATFFLGAINCFMTILTYACVDRFGRRFLMLSGTALAAGSLFAASGMLFSMEAWPKEWIFVAFALYTLGYCMSVGSLFWVIIAEIYPLQLRGFAMSLATVVQWSANFMVSLSFLTLYQSWGKAFPFAIYGGGCLLAFGFVYYFLPETTGASLEQIENRLYAGKKLRELGQDLAPWHNKKNTTIVVET